MESAVPLLLFLGFLFGSMLLILIFAGRGIADRFNEPGVAESPEPAAARDGSRFFADMGVTPDAPAYQTTWAMPWKSVEAHLRHEHEMASAFVAAPSLQMLFAHSSPEQTPYADRLERHVQDESRRVTDLIQRSPTKSLYPNTRPLTFIPTRRDAIDVRVPAELRVAPWGDGRTPGDER